MALRSEQRLDIAPDWLPDDTEESVLGSEWHQEAIHILADMLRDVALKRGVSWGIYEQVELRGVRRQNGRPYPLRPDVFVIGRQLDPTHDIRAVGLADVGAPLFVAEVSSRSTVRNDIDGKAEVYGRIGVPEYLVFDPTKDILGMHIRAWRLDPHRQGRYQPWVADEDGYWRSDILGVSLRPQPHYVSMRDVDGEDIGLPVENGERARAAERALREAQETTRRLEEEIRRMRARFITENPAEDQGKL